MGQCMHTPGSDHARVQVELSRECEYLDQAIRHGPRKATLDAEALHDTPIDGLKRVQTKDLDLTPEILSPRTWLCSPSHLCSASSVPGPALQRAKQITGRGRWMVELVGHESEDLNHRDWPGPGRMEPLDELLEESDPAAKTAVILQLARAAKKVLASEPTLVDVGAPVRIFGDIHGQFRDMLLLLQDFPFDGEHGTTYVFNGDFVDRGRHQLEVITLLMALKIAFPHCVQLLRGNHEDIEMNKHMGPCGFCHHCFRRLGPQMGWQVVSAISEVFNVLPLACLACQQILVLHGGIGAGNWDLESLRTVTRPLTHDDLASCSVLWNILWSDPIPDEAEDHFGVHDSPRDNHQNIMKTFGKDVTQWFCARHGLSMVIRSHQARKGGCGYEVMHSMRCVRVFSARDYEGNENDGSTLLISRVQPTGKLVVLPQVLRSLTKVPKGDKWPDRNSFMLPFGWPRSDSGSWWSSREANTEG